MRNVLKNRSPRSPAAWLVAITTAIASLVCATSTTALAGSTVWPSSRAVSPIQIESRPGVAARTEAPSLLVAPQVTMHFYSNNVFVAGSSLMVIVLNNPINNSDITGVHFSDDLPAGLLIGNSGATNSCGGTLTAAPNGTSVSLSNGTVYAGLACAIEVEIVGTPRGAGSITLES